MRFITAPSSPEDFPIQSPMVFVHTPNGPELIDLNAVEPDPLIPTHEREDSCPACHEVQITVKPTGSTSPSQETNVPPCSPAGQFLLQQVGPFIHEPKPLSDPPLEQPRPNPWARPG